MTNDIRSLGQEAYEAYSDFCGNVNLFTGKRLPLWADLSLALKGAWGMSAKAVLMEYEKVTNLPDSMPDNTSAFNPEIPEDKNLTDGWKM